MARKQKKEWIVEGLEVEKYGSEGVAIGYVEEKVIFIPFAAPGDVVDVRITKKKRRHLEAKILRFEKYADVRREPFPVTK